jgi:hypothetical protein
LGAISERRNCLEGLREHVVEMVLRFVMRSQKLAPD